jgi:hypothetical protein
MSSIRLSKSFSISVLAVAALLGPVLIAGLRSSGVFDVEKPEIEVKKSIRPQHAEEIDRISSEIKQKEKGLERLQALINNLESQKSEIEGEIGELKKKLAAPVAPESEKLPLFSPEEFFQKLENFYKEPSYEAWLEIRKRAPENVASILIEEIENSTDPNRICRLSYTLGSFADNKNLGTIITYLDAEPGKLITESIVTSLAQRKHRETLPYLRKMLSECEKPLERRSIMYLIATATPDEGVPMLIKEYHTAENREGIPYTLTRIDSVEQYDFLTELALRPDSADELVIAIGAYFARVGSPDAIRTLEEILDRENLAKPVRERLSDSLKKLKQARERGNK